ncbi:MAG: lytic transglycosylase domain-containing protein [Candidatus Bathyarchaeota archaeon]|nr:lytic transglycosylase domain-containing protein [Candidatus Bathyarchaeota archaeon]
MKAMEDLFREVIRQDLLEEFNRGMEKGLPQDKIDSNIRFLKRQLEEKYGIPFSKANGGEIFTTGSQEEKDLITELEGRDFTKEMQEEQALRERERRMLEDQEREFLNRPPSPQRPMFSHRTPPSQEPMFELNTMEFDGREVPVIEFKDGENLSFPEIEGLFRTYKTAPETNLGPETTRQILQFLEKNNPTKEQFIKHFFLSRRLAEGGEVTEGIGSLSSIARNMNNGGEADSKRTVFANKLIDAAVNAKGVRREAKEKFVEGDYAAGIAEYLMGVNASLPVYKQIYAGVGQALIDADKQGDNSFTNVLKNLLNPQNTISFIKQKMNFSKGGEVENDGSIRALGNLEYEADMRPFLQDSLSQLGFNADRASYNSQGLNRGDTYSFFTDKINIDPKRGGASQEIQAHEYRHRGLQRLLDDYFMKDPGRFKEKYGTDAYNLMLEVYDESRGKSENLTRTGQKNSIHEKIAEYFQKPQKFNMGVLYYTSDGRVFQTEEQVKNYVKQNPGVEFMRKEIEGDADITLETPRVKEFRDYMINKNRGETMQQGTDSEFEAVQSIQKAAADVLSGKYGKGGEVTEGIGSLNSVARNMNTGGEVDAEVEAIIPAVIMAESSNDPRAVSEDGAIGLMQVLPETAMQPGYGVPNIFEIARAQGFDVQDESLEMAKKLLFSPDLNVEFGSQYLKAMRRNFDTMEDALRAYNAGPGNFNAYLAGGRDLSLLDQEAIDYPTKVAAANQGVNPNEPAEFARFSDSPEAFSAFMTSASEERPERVTRPKLRPMASETLFAAPVPPQRPEDPSRQQQQKEAIEQTVREVVNEKQPLQEKYSPEGIEQMLIGTIGESLLPRLFQRGSPYSSRP